MAEADAAHLWGLGLDGARAREQERQRQDRQQRQERQEQEPPRQPENGGRAALQWPDHADFAEGRAPAGPQGLRHGSDGEFAVQRWLGTVERADRFYDEQMLDHLNERMREFVGRQEMFFLATSDRNGECDSSFRAGPPGFLRVLDERTLVYPEYRGNGVNASLGNMQENPHLGIMLIDFTRARIGLHVNGRATLIEDGDMRAAYPDLPHDPVPGRRAQLWVRVQVEEAYIHCAKHIPHLQPVPKGASRDWGTDDYKRKGGDFFGVARDGRVAGEAGPFAEPSPQPPPEADELPDIRESVVARDGLGALDELPQDERREREPDGAREPASAAAGEPGGSPGLDGNHIALSGFGDWAFRNGTGNGTGHGSGRGNGTGTGTGNGPWNGAYANRAYRNGAFGGRTYADQASRDVGQDVTAAPAGSWDPSPTAADALSAAIAARAAAVAAQLSPAPPPVPEPPAPPAPAFAEPAPEPEPIAATLTPSSPVADWRQQAERALAEAQRRGGESEHAPFQGWFG